jgi:hypothetical protein
MYSSFTWTFTGLLALSLAALVGCGDDGGGAGGTGGTGGTGGVAGMGGTGGAGGAVIDAIEEMMVGRWWLDWDQASGNPTPDGIGIATFTADGWANYDVVFGDEVSPPIPDWCRRYADWSLFDVVSETEFSYTLTYTQDTCNREADTTEQFKVVLDQMNPPKGDVTRLLGVGNPEYTLPIERCTTDINANVACTFDTGLGVPTQNP